MPRRIETGAWIPRSIRIAAAKLPMAGTEPCHYIPNQKSRSPKTPAF
ncbi:MAG: hypothetical protein ABFD46_12975 [Armatimonadota bacterium]